MACEKLMLLLLHALIVPLFGESVKCVDPTFDTAVHARKIHLMLTTSLVFENDVDNLTKENCLSAEGEHIALLEDYLEQTLAICLDSRNATLYASPLRQICRDKHQVDYFVYHEKSNNTRSHARRIEVSLPLMMGIFLCMKINFK